MVAISRRQVPPWELCSRISYAKWKDRKNKNKLNFKHMCISYKLYERERSAIKIGDTHQPLETTQDSYGIGAIQSKLNPYISDIGIRLQQLAHTPLSKYQSRQCDNIIKSIESAIPYISWDSVFKLLVSYSKVVNSLVYMPLSGNFSNHFNLKLSSHETCKKMFKYLEDRDFKMNSENIYLLIESYIRLCVGYAEHIRKFSKIYKDAIKLIVSGNVKLSTNDHDRLLLLFDRMGIYDKDYVMYYGNKISGSFSQFTQNQIGNFCRYMTKLPFIERQFPITHIDLLKAGSRYRDAQDNTLLSPSKDGNDLIGGGISGLQCVKRLPRHYTKTLLNRRRYNFKPKVDYSVSLSEDDQKCILEGWDFKRSKFIKTLNRRLPYVLHQYTYFNLIDVAEMFYIYSIKSDLLPRFSTELWKYLYTLKYGYPLKSLIVLSCLKQGDAITYGRLIRNIPAALCFNWSPELVAEGLVACGSLGIKSKFVYKQWTIMYSEMSIYNKLSEYLQRRILYFKNPNLICRIFESLSLAKIPQYGIYLQMVALAESFPDWLHLKHLVLIAKSCSVVGILERRMFRLIISRLNQVGECSVRELVPIINLSSKVELDDKDSEDFYRFIIHFVTNISEKDLISYEDLLELLEGMVSIQVRTVEIEKMALKVLGSTDNEIDVVKVLKNFGILGKIESMELLQILETHIDKNLKEHDEYDLSSLIWDMISVGYDLYSDILLKVVKKFTQLRPKKFNTHLLTVVASLIRLSDGNNLIWKDFLKIVDGYKDYSWSKGTENCKIIKSIANTIKDSKTFVQQFPYTIDIAAMYKNIDNIAISGNNIMGEKSNGNGMEYKGMSNYDKEDWMDVGNCKIENGPISNDLHNDVALFYYNNEENPLILHIRPDGTHEHNFNFYYQTRKKILQSRGWKDTLIFSPNNQL